VHRDDPGVVTTPRGFASAPAAREHIAEDLAADVVALLEAQTTLAGGERLHPGHVAVLVRTHGHATEVQDALGRAGVPAVIAGAGSVFGTPPRASGSGCSRRLSARRRRPARTRRADPVPRLERVAGGRGHRRGLEAVHQRLHRWASVLRDSGVAALAETVTLAEGLPARVLGADDGERALTDLRHVGELLHAAAARDGLGVAALTAWLGRRVAAAGHEVESEERTRRLESDARAVQVLTIHRSKGLEFPVVYVPFAWQPSWIPDQHGPVDFHREGSGERVLDVGVGGRATSRTARGGSPSSAGRTCGCCTSR
jgi:exodeoxyribonuclease V beta subunit